MTEKVLSRKARLDAGQAARKQLGRRALGEFENKRRFDPIDVLLTTRAGRLPRLLPVKFKRMSSSPFSFFRGAVAIMAADLGHAKHTGLIVQLCGDAHVQNLGSLEAPDGRIVFDINDFDETIAGPWEWDVKRMVASIVLAGFEMDHTETTCKAAAANFAASYVQNLSELAKQPVLTAGRHQIHRLKKCRRPPRRCNRRNPLVLPI